MEKIPGPGAYNNLLSFTNQERGVTIATKLKIGNIINFDEKSKIPGPAAYETEKSTGAIRPVRPKFSFPREARNSESKMSNFPDPTSYTPKLLRYGPTISIAIRAQNSSSVLKTPGPGAYTLQGSFDRFEGMFPNQTHTVLKLNNSKGSLNKSVDSEDHHRAGLVKSSMNMNKMRESLNKTEILTKRDHVNTSYSTTNANHQGAARQTLTALANNNPGPGAYKTFYDTILKKNPRAIIGTSKRRELTSKDVIASPGPSNYLPNIEAVRRSPNHWTIGNGQRVGGDTLRESTQSPGPAAYTIKPERLSGLIQAPRAFIAGKNSIDSL